MTAELRAFLNARLDDDERVARAAVATLLVNAPAETGRWRSDMDVATGVDGDELVAHVVRDETHPDEGYATVGQFDDPCGGGKARHAARWDPARVLAHVTATRHVLALCEQEHRDADANTGDWSLIHGGRAKAFDHVVRALATPYAGHPAARAEWGLVWAP